MSCFLGVSDMLVVMYMEKYRYEGEEEEELEKLSILVLSPEVFFFFFPRAFQGVILLNLLFLACQPRRSLPVQIWMACMLVQGVKLESDGVSKTVVG